MASSSVPVSTPSDQPFRFYNDDPTSASRISVAQMLHRQPQLCVMVVSDSEARAVRDGRGQLLGTRTILRLDSKRSAVVYSNLVSDWNTVAAVARVRVSHEVIPIMDWAPPGTPRKCVVYYSKVFLLFAAVTIVGVLLYKAVLYGLSLVIWALFFSRTPSSTTHGTQAWLRTQASSRVIGVYHRLTGVVRRRIQVVLKAIVIWLEGFNDAGILGDAQKAAAAEL